MRRLFRVVACVLAVAVTLSARSPAAELSGAAPGQIVKLDLTTLDEIPILDAKLTAKQETPLLFSDGPEYFPGDGVALREELKPGRFRLYLYHCPEATGAKKVISATIDNLSDQPMKLHFVRYGFQKPGGDYLKIGKSGLIDYFSARKGPADQTIAPHSRGVIDPQLDQTQVKKDELVHAFHEIEIDQPARVIVFQRDPKEDSLKVVEKLQPLDPKHHGAGRGKFLTTDYDVEAAFDPSAGAGRIVIADGKSDPWIKGHDALGDVESTNKGNYGVMYHIRITPKKSDRAVAVLICKPQEDSDKYCPGSAAAVKVGDDVVALPKDRVSFKQFPQAVMIKKLAPGESLEMTYSPPGASCLPTPILLVPIQEK